MERKENVVFLGPPGVGKTHLAISLAIATAESGRRVYYGTLTDPIDFPRGGPGRRTPELAIEILTPPPRSWSWTRSAISRSAAAVPSSSSSSSPGATSAVMEWAVAMDFRPDNPCDRIGPVLGAQKNVVRHMRALPHGEVAAAIEAVRASSARGRS